MKHAIQINLKLLAAVNFMASKEEARYYLNGVNLEARGGWLYMVGTNGSGLLVARQEIDPELEFNNCIVPRTFIDDLKVKHRGIDYVPMDLEGDADVGFTLSFHLPDRGIRTTRTIDGTFPDWIRVVPEKVERGHGHFLLEHLTLFQKAAKLLNGITRTNPVVHPSNDGGAGLVTLATSKDIFGVLMPDPKVTRELPTEVSRPFQFWDKRVVNEAA